MQVVSRAQLTGYLTGPSMDPDQNLPELGHQADLILANSQATHFLVLDCENGDDPRLDYEFGATTTSVLEDQDGANGYYGVSYQQKDRDDQSPKVFNCWLGGSQLQSAAGYIVAEVTAE